MASSKSSVDKWRAILRVAEGSYAALTGIILCVQAAQAKCVRCRVRLQLSSDDTYYDSALSAKNEIPRQTRIRKSDRLCCLWVLAPRRGGGAKYATYGVLYSKSAPGPLGLTLYGTVKSLASHAFVFSLIRIRRTR